MANENIRIFAISINKQESESDLSYSQESESDLSYSQESESDLSYSQESDLSYFQESESEVQTTDSPALVSIHSSYPAVSV